MLWGASCNFSSTGASLNCSQISSHKPRGGKRKDTFSEGVIPPLKSAKEKRTFARNLPNWIWILTLAGMCRTARGDTRGKEWRHPSGLLWWRDDDGCSCISLRSRRNPISQIQAYHTYLPSRYHTELGTRCSLQRRGEQTEIPINHPVTSREPRRGLLLRISQ